MVDNITKCSFTVFEHNNKCIQATHATLRAPVFENFHCDNHYTIRHDINRDASGLVMVPCIVRIDRIVIREEKYQLEVNRCRNEEFQGSSAKSVGRDSGTDRRRR
ncbi:hypothetical protein DPMN_001529 [Dreissena polymorpha]|uniref:Uncharacterized protein n=1 Tax=Dreissena polymorpha TaxID=45954 RepID=A0A9D4MIK7_DREPO|nr:hypothetical protein DPMN_001529 [Dreissena polymorpha]